MGPVGRIPPEKLRRIPTVVSRPLRHSGRMRALAALAVSVVLLLTGCGGDDDPPAEDTSGATSGTSSGGDGPALVADVCAALTGDDVTAALGNGTYVAEASPGGGCEYQQDDPRAGYLTVTQIEGADGGGYESYVSAFGSTFKDPVVREVSGIGDAATVATGEIAMAESNQGAAVARLGTVMVTVNYSESGAAPEALGESAEKALRIAVEKLG